MDRVVSSLRTAPYWDENERPRRDPFRRLAAMSEGVSPGYTAIVCGKDPFPLFCHVAAFLSVPARMSVGVICRENTPDVVMSEMISCVSGIPPYYLRERKVPPPLFATLNTTLSQIYDAPLYFSHSEKANPKSIYSLARRLKRRYQIRVLMIDSLESCAGTDANRSALLRTSEELQAITESFGLCLMATSRSHSIYKSLRRGAVINADGYEW